MRNPIESRRGGKKSVSYPKSPQFHTLLSRHFSFCATQTLRHHKVTHTHTFSHIRNFTTSLSRLLSQALQHCIFCSFAKLCISCGRVGAQFCKTPSHFDPTHPQRVHAPVTFNLTRVANLLCGKYLLCFVAPSPQQLPIRSHFVFSQSTVMQKTLVFSCYCCQHVFWQRLGVDFLISRPYCRIFAHLCSSTYFHKSTHTKYTYTNALTLYVHTHA